VLDVALVVNALDHEFDLHTGFEITVLDTDRHLTEHHEFFFRKFHRCDRVRLEGVVGDVRCRGFVEVFGVGPDGSNPAEPHFLELRRLTSGIAAVRRFLGKEIGLAAAALGAEQLRLRARGKPSFDGGYLFSIGHAQSPRCLVATLRFSSSLQFYVSILRFSSSFQF